MSRIAPLFTFKPFVPDLHGFSVVKTTISVYDDKTPRFTITDNTYYTLYGPLFYNEDLQYPGSGPLELRAGLTSLLQVRKPEFPGFHGELFSSQRNIHRRFRPSLHKLLKHMKLHYDTSSVDAEHTAWLLQLHPKRRLRINAHTEYIRSGGLVIEKGYVSFKLKNGELLPAGKKRGIVDIGLLTTNLTGFIVDNIKAAFAVPFTINNCEFHFIKTAEVSNVKQLYDRIMTSDKPVFGLHGDDSVGCYDCTDGRIFFNADISKCDGSHGAPVITTLHALLSKLVQDTGLGPYLDRAFAALSLDLKYANPKNRSENIKYRFKQPRLFSGSVLTTITNSFANLLIGLAVSLGGQVTKAQFKDHFEACARSVGYIVTIHCCACVEEMQFLKMSPVKTVNGNFVPIMNLGAWIKNFGVFKGDLPGRGDVYKRSTNLIKDIVVSRRHWGNHQLSWAFTAMVDRMTPVLHGADMSPTGDQIDLDSLLARYNHYDRDSFLQFCDMVATATIGCVVNHPFTRIAFAIDYG